MEYAGFVPVRNVATAETRFNPARRWICPGCLEAVVNARITEVSRSTYMNRHPDGVVYKTAWVKYFKHRMQFREQRAELRRLDVSPPMGSVAFFDPRTEAMCCT